MTTDFLTAESNSAPEPVPMFYTQKEKVDWDSPYLIAWDPLDKDLAKLTLHKCIIYYSDGTVIDLIAFAAGASHPLRKLSEKNLSILQRRYIKYTTKYILNLTESLDDCTNNQH